MTGSWPGWGDWVLVHPRTASRGPVRCLYLCSILVPYPEEAADIDNGLLESLIMMGSSANTIVVY